MSRAETAYTSTFQVRIRLQALYSDVQRSLQRRKTGLEGGICAIDLLTALQAMAHAAEREELCGFATACLHVAESIEPLTRHAEIPDSTLQSLQMWLYLADMYLRRGATPATALAIIAPLRTAPLGHALSSEEDAALVRSLLEPGTPHR